MTDNNKWPEAKEAPFSIVCDIPTVVTEGVTSQVLVDRKKEPDAWWTYSDPSVIFRISSMRLAEQLVGRFKHNNPRIVSWRVAQKLLEKQAELCK